MRLVRPRTLRYLFLVGLALFATGFITLVAHHPGKASAFTVPPGVVSVSRTAQSSRAQVDTETPASPSPVAEVPLVGLPPSRPGTRSINQSTREEGGYAGGPRTVAQASGGEEDGGGNAAPEQKPSAIPPAFQRPSSVHSPKPQKRAAVAAPSDTSSSPFASEPEATEWPLLEHVLSAAHTGTLKQGAIGELLPAHVASAALPSSATVTEAALLSALADDTASHSRWSSVREVLFSSQPWRFSKHANPEPGKHTPEDVLTYIAQKQNSNCPECVFLEEVSETATFPLHGAPALVLGDSRGHLSHLIATGAPHSVVVTVMPPQSALPPNTLSDVDVYLLLKTVVSTPNAPLCSAVINAPFVKLVLSHSVPWGAVVVPDLAVLVNDVLPHEFESVLGSVMTLSNFLLLPPALPDSKYFSYWTSLASLVTAAAASAHLSVVTKSIPNGRGSAEWTLVVSRATELVREEDAAISSLVTIADALNAAEGGTGPDPSPAAAAAGTGGKGGSPSASPSTADAGAKSDSRHVEDALTASVFGAPPRNTVPLSVLVAMGLVQHDVREALGMLLRAPISLTAVATWSAKGVVPFESLHIHTRPGSAEHVKDHQGRSINLTPSRPSITPSPGRSSAVQVPKAYVNPSAGDHWSGGSPPPPVSLAVGQGDATGTSRKAPSRGGDAADPGLNTARVGRADAAAAAAPLVADAAGAGKAVPRAEDGVGLEAGKRSAGDAVVPKAGVAGAAYSGSTGARKDTGASARVDAPAAAGADTVPAPIAGADPRVAPAAQVPPAAYALPAARGNVEGLPPSAVKDAAAALHNDAVDAYSKRRSRPAPAVTIDEDADGEGPGGDAGAAAAHLRGRTRQLLSVLVSDRTAEEQFQLAEAQSLSEDAEYRDMIRALLASRAATRNKDWAAKSAGAQEVMVEEQSEALRALWLPLQREFAGVRRLADGRTVPVTQHVPANNWPVLVYGGDMGLLSTKIARSFPEAAVLTVHPQPHAVAPHLALVDVLGVRNNVIGRAKLTRPRVAALRAASDPFRFQVLGLDVFEDVLGSAGRLDEFEAHLGSLLQLAATSFVELPDWADLVWALGLLRSEPQAAPAGDSVPFATDGVRLDGTEGTEGAPPVDTTPPAEASLVTQVVERYGGGQSLDHSMFHVGECVSEECMDLQREAYLNLLGKAAAAAGLAPQAVSLRFLTHHEGVLEGEAPPPPPASSTFRNMRDLFGGEEAASPSPSPSPEPRSRVPWLVRVDVHEWAKAPAVGPKPRGSRFPLPGLSIHALLTLGLVPALKADLFKLYLTLPLHDLVDAGASTLSPLNIRYVCCSASQSGYLQVYVEGADGGMSPVEMSGEGVGVATRRRGSAVPPELEVAYNRGKTRALLSQFVAPDVNPGGLVGRFSCMEHNSGTGSLSLILAHKFPEATVVSVEGDNSLSDIHLARALKMNITNNIICGTNSDASLMKKLFRSPEFMRFQILSGDFLDLLGKHGAGEYGAIVGHMFGSGMTTFLSVPPAALLSLAFTTLFYTYPNPVVHTAAAVSGAVTYDSLVVPGGRRGPVVEVGDAVTLSGLGGDGSLHRLEEEFELEYHPRPAFVHGESRLLRGLVTGSTATRVSLSVVRLPASSGGDVDTGIVRVDVGDVSRPVIHHFEANLDGHERTYTFHAQVNESVVMEEGEEPGGVAPLPLGHHHNNGVAVSVYLVRSHDSSVIPYVSLYGVTLISMLRMGLKNAIKVRAYHQFVALPLYQDMAPWNIVFVGPRLDYIDYDTKDHNFNALVPKLYQTMEVLFNYKRTVEDFKRCGTKAPVVYGFGFVSDCVGSQFKGPCKNNAFPVPCGDGTCRSDYVDCLRAMSRIELDDAAAAEAAKLPPVPQEGEREGGSTGGSPTVWSFDDKGPMRKAKAT